MNAKEFVDSLFEGYEETAALADFKEELRGNLDAKIESLIKKGMDGETAFAKASAELGDVSALADELSLKKRREVFEEVYMDVRKYMSTGRIAAYVVFGMLALFGIAAGAIAFFSTRGIGLDMNLTMTSLFALMMPFMVAAAAAFTFLGVTQETASTYPTSRKRAFWYAVAATLITFGLFIMPIVFFGSKSPGEFFDGLLARDMAIVTVVSMIIPFVLPGVGLLVFLLLTEKDRLKPWAKAMLRKADAIQEEAKESMWKDKQATTRFGMSCVAIWIFALGTFLFVGFMGGWAWSWLVFIFAAGFQILLRAFMGYRQTQ